MYVKQRLIHAKTYRAGRTEPGVRHERPPWAHTDAKAQRQHSALTPQDKAPVFSHSVVASDACAACCDGREQLRCLRLAFAVPSRWR